MFKIFIVNENTWPEHKQAGIAAINDPVVTHPGRNSMKARQGAVSEVAGIRPEDKILFYIMGIQKIYGVYEATTNSFFDPQPLFSGAQHVRDNLPFRVGFKEIIEFKKPLAMEEIWKAKEERNIWSIQQSRGDRVGVRGNWSISKPEFELIVNMLKEVNLTFKNVSVPSPTIGQMQPLPINDRQIRSRECQSNIFNYEDALISLIIEGLRGNIFQNIFGQFDDILVKAPTGSRKELDILLVRYDERGKKIIWFQIIEVKKGLFVLDHALQLQGYYEWYRQEIKDGNHRNVYPIALAFCFDDEVKEYVRNLKKYKIKAPRLIEYRYQNQILTLSDVTP
jgi:hypothetical protein